MAIQPSYQTSVDLQHITLEHSIGIKHHNDTVMLIKNTLNNTQCTGSIYIHSDHLYPDI